MVLVLVASEETRFLIWSVAEGVMARRGPRGAALPISAAS